MSEDGKRIDKAESAAFERQWRLETVRREVPEGKIPTAPVDELRIEVGPMYGATEGSEVPQHPAAPAPEVEERRPHPRG
jgi:hypothetical protein